MKEIFVDFLFIIPHPTLYNTTMVYITFVHIIWDQMKQPIVRSQQQRYRLWFEFLKLAKKEPNLQSNLARSADFYAPWGDVENQSFDPWWRQHKNLFGQTVVTEVDRVVRADNVLYVAIPLNQPSSRSISDVKVLIEEKQRKQLFAQGIEPSSAKSLSTAFGRYDFTPGVEIRGRTLYEVQLIYGLYQSLGKPAVNSVFADRVVRFFKERPRSKWSPYILSLAPQKEFRGNLRYDQGQLRQLRRYLKRGYAVCEAVSKGEFPGTGTM